MLSPMRPPRTLPSRRLPIRSFHAPKTLTLTLTSASPMGDVTVDPSASTATLTLTSAVPPPQVQFWDPSYTGFTYTVSQSAGGFYVPLDLSTVSGANATFTVTATPA